MLGEVGSDNAIVHHQLLRKPKACTTVRDLIKTKNTCSMMGVLELGNGSSTKLVTAYFKHFRD